MVDYGRAPYKTRARLYPDSDQEFDVVWYIARDDAPLYRGPRALNNLEWERDREDWLQTSVGEIFGTRTETTDWKSKPLALGDHQCGTPADFAGDGVFNDQPPFVTYRNDGLPTCCGWKFLADGGAAGSGQGFWSWNAQHWAGTCCDAPLSVAGTTYVGTLVTTGLPPQVYQYNLTAGPATFDWEFTGPTLAFTVQITRGPNCGFQPVVLLAGNFGSGPVPFTVDVTATVCVNLILQFPVVNGNYTLKITQP